MAKETQEKLDAQVQIRMTKKLTKEAKQAIDQHLTCSNLFWTFVRRFA